MLVALLATACTSCFENHSAEVRFRVDAVVQEHGESRQGSAVWSMALKRPILALASPYDAHFEGEAIPIQMPDRKWVLVLPTNLTFGYSAGLWPERIFGVSQREGGKVRDRIDVLRDVGMRRGASVDLDCVELHAEGATAGSDLHCPSLMRASDLGDPESYVLVDESAERKRDPDAPHLQRITVTITDAPVTRRLDKVAPWLNRVRVQAYNELHSKRRTRASTAPR